MDLDLRIAPQVPHAQGLRRHYKSTAHEYQII